MFLLLALMAIVTIIFGQKIAVLNFQAGVGISQDNVTGISSMFTTEFKKSGNFTLVERSQIDNAIREQGFQSGNMTQSQMVKIGEILNVSMIVIGDINIIMGQYNVDVRVVSVETGAIIATEGKQFTESSFRECIRSIAQKLASQISTNLSSDYVDLGLPSGTKWKKTNESGGFYTYDQAVKKFGIQLPSNEQIQELMRFCNWEWKRNGRVISIQGTGPNGKTIEFMPVGVKVLSNFEENGRTYYAGDVVMIGVVGEYLSRDTGINGRNETFVHTIHIYYDGGEHSNEFKPRGINPSIMAGSVRLVK